ncbi:hypothetical protein NMY22_g18525 [Coprinellus aureogranulatus]|nr:hypothetical protein NMY22_g18525 [Coprinellus aureogranulatus]
MYNSSHNGLNGSHPSQQNAPYQQNDLDFTMNAAANDIQQARLRRTKSTNPFDYDPYDRSNDSPPPPVPPRPHALVPGVSSSSSVSSTSSHSHSQSYSTSSNTPSSNYAAHNSNGPRSPPPPPRPPKQQHFSSAPTTATIGNVSGNYRNQGS